MRKLGLVLLVTLITVTGCTKKVHSDNKTIFVSILPQKYFVEQITGDLWNVETLVKPGYSPAVYEPTPQQFQKLQDAALFFTIGVPYEKNFLNNAQALLKSTKVVPTDEEIERQPMQSFEEIIDAMSDHHIDNHEKNVDHEEHDHHSNGHMHEHGELDPHIWLSPKLVRIQLKTILNSLIELDFENKDIYEKNFDSFLKKINDIELEIKNNLEELEVRSFAVFHPSWGYFARDFNLKQIPIEISGKTPNSKETTEIIKLLKENNIKVIFIQKQFDSSVAKSIAGEIDGKVIIIDPLAYNYLENISKISGIFKEALTQ